MLDKMNEHHTVWAIVDSHWRCVSDSDITDTFAEFISRVGFDIPSNIYYCLAENDRYKLKFRQTGGVLSVYLNPI